MAGLAIVDDGDIEYALHAGDALVIPPSLPHGIHKRGTEAVVVATLAWRARRPPGDTQAVGVAVAEPAWDAVADLDESGGSLRCQRW